MIKRNKKWMALLISAMMTFNMSEYAVFAAEDLFTDQAVWTEETESAGAEGIISEEMTAEVMQEEAVGESAAEVPDSWPVYGMCGENAYWSLYEGGLLVIKGAGAVTGREWSEKYSVYVKNVVIEKYISSLPSNMFDGCSPEKISFHGFVPNIDEHAFEGMNGPVTVYAPCGIPEWDSATMGSYGGDVIWEIWHPEYDGNYEIVTIPAVEPTCTEDGLTEGGCCSVCGEILVPQEVVPKTDHHYVNGICSDCPRKLSYITPTNVRISKLSYVYKGKAIKPKVTVIKSGKKLIAGVDYKVTYRNNTEPGTATVIITGMGKYYCEHKRKFTITSNLETPSITSLKNSSKGITIKWKKVPGAANYRVFRKTDAGRWVRALETKETTAVDTKVKSGKTYQYTVRCISTDGTLFTSDFNKTGRKCLRLRQPPLSGASSNESGITVRWKGAAGAKGYSIYRKTADTSWKKIGTVSASKRSYTDKKASRGVEYRYSVGCYNGKTVSSYHAKGVPGFYLNVPVLYGCERVADGIRISWSEVEGAQYDVFKKEDDGAWRFAARTGRTEYTDIFAEEGRYYTYTVRAVRSRSKAVSDCDEEGVSYATLAAPKLVSAENTASGVRVKWRKVTGAQGYQIFRKTLETDWEKIASVTGGTRVSYTDKKAERGTLYTYTVKACIGESAGDSGSEISCIRN